MAELDDDREGFEPEVQDEDAGDPAAAFDALRQTVESLAGDLTREMTTIRKGVEAAFEELDRQGPPQDYKPELAQLVQQLAQVGERLQGVEQSPILKQGAQHYAAVLERSGEGLVRTAVQQLERQAADLERAGRNLSAHVASARERNRQNSWLVVTGLAGLLAGVVLTLFVPALLPGSAALRVAGVVTGQNYWSAGLDMMRLHNATRLNALVYADELMQANGDAVMACYRKAQQSKKEQSCTINVPVPPPATAQQ